MNNEFNKKTQSKWHFRWVRHHIKRSCYFKYLKTRYSGISFQILYQYSRTGPSKLGVPRGPFCSEIFVLSVNIWCYFQLTGTDYFLILFLYQPGFNRRHSSISTIFHVTSPLYLLWGRDHATWRFPLSFLGTFLLRIHEQSTTGKKN